MIAKSLTITRRAFLSGVGATVAISATQAVAAPLFKLQPLEAAVIVEGADGFDGLSCILGLETIDTTNILTASNSLRTDVETVLMPNCYVASLDATRLRRNASQLPRDLLVLGRWKGREKE